MLSKILNTQRKKKKSVKIRPKVIHTAGIFRFEDEKKHLF